jgi:hypothetical protein
MVQQLILISYFVVCILSTIIAIIYPEKGKSQFKKILATIGIIGIAFGTILIFINTMWYAKQQEGNFKWFDDSGEWMQMDKLGHFFSSYIISRVCLTLLLWSGVAKNRAIIFGGLSGLLLLSPVEIMDGFSKGYGASYFDIIANACGSIFILIQYKWIGKLAIYNKFSFNFTSFAALRPNLLGSNAAENFMKDYNGQTYWFSFPMYKISWLRMVPKWLHLSIGFGADGMLGGDDNIWDQNGKVYNRTDVARSRQIYISFDINFEHFVPKQNWKKVLFFTINQFKFPAPTLEINLNEGLRWHYLYF